jgi:hypothetical protein
MVTINSHNQQNQSLTTVDGVDDDGTTTCRPGAVCCLWRLRRRPRSSVRREQSRANLAAEVAAHTAHTKSVIQGLSARKDSWLTESKVLKLKETSLLFLRCCAFPRLKFSVVDARYCAQFVRVLHDIGTPGFSSLAFFDHVVRVVVPTATWVTRGEVSNMGVFLRDIWALLLRWYSSETTYDKECATKPGFALNTSGKMSDYESFRKAFKTWHTKIAAICIKWLHVDIKETHCTQNVLTLLSRLLPHYPSSYEVVKILALKCRDLRAREKGCVRGLDCLPANLPTCLPAVWSGAAAVALAVALPCRVLWHS